MINNVSNGVSFGALKYASGETKGIINSEFNTPELKAAAQDLFEKIDQKSTEQGVDIVLDAYDFKGDSRMPAATFVSAMDIDSYTAMCDDNIGRDAIDSYGNGTENTLTKEYDKMQELQRFGASVIKKLQSMEPSIANTLESFKNLFN